MTPMAAARRTMIATTTMTRGSSILCASSTSGRHRLQRKTARTSSLPSARSLLRGARPALGIRPGSLQIHFDLRHDLGTLSRDVLVLVGIVRDIVQFEGLALFQAYCFPVARAHGLLETVLVKLPVQDIVPLLCTLAGQGRYDREAVQPRGRLRA